MLSRRSKASNNSVWTVEEDSHLLTLVQEFGICGSWPKIALQISNRSGKDCRSRYVNDLDPGIKRSMWTHDEDAVIKEMYNNLGGKWSKIMAYLPGRSDNAIRTRYHIISRDNYSDHNHHSIVKRAFVLDAASANFSKENKSFVPETIAVRLQRFRLARDLMDAKINILIAETELENEKMRMEVDSPSGKLIVRSCSKLSDKGDPGEDSDSTCSTSLSGSENENDLEEVERRPSFMHSLSYNSISSISNSICSPRVRLTTKPSGTEANCATPK